MVWKINGEDAYFAASNSKKGFFSYYTACFDAPRIDRVFAVKGGPGTGKSRFLRDVASFFAERAFSVEYVYCSSDPNSLDGVILTKNGSSIALLDATAPHVYEPLRIGVREEIVNLGAFWDRAKLVQRRDEIETLSAQKSAAYRRAYRYLASIGELLALRDDLVAPFVRRDAIKAYAEKLMRQIPMGRVADVRTTLVRSVGMCGEVGIWGSAMQGTRLVLIEDLHGIARYLTDALLDLALERRQLIRVSHDPIDPARIDAICLSDCGITFLVGRQEPALCADKTIGMRRFLDTLSLSDRREALNVSARARRLLTDGAMAAFTEVKEAHFALEAIYSSTMDFSAKEEYTRQFCNRLGDLQNA